MRSNVITVSYRDRDPDLAVRVLEELVNRYFDKHLEVHRSKGAFDVVSRQSDELRGRLNQIDEQIKDLKGKAGIVSLPESLASLDSELTQSEEGLRAAEAEAAEQQARIVQLERALGDVSIRPAPDVQNSSQPKAPAGQASGREIQEHQGLGVQLSALRQRDLDLRAKYTPENRLVQTNQAQINELERKQRALEEAFPSLLATGRLTASPPGQQLDLVSERARMAGLEARIDARKARLTEVRERVKRVAEFGPQIAQLERRKEVEETNFKYLGSNLEKARVDEALDPSKMPNISVVQKPSPAVSSTSDRDKAVAAFAGGGLVLGLAFALLTELVFNRTVKHPRELEAQLRIFVMLSIPRILPKDQSRLLLEAPPPAASRALVKNGSWTLPPWEVGHFIRPYAEAISDRLCFHFESNSLTHKPKLVAVAGFTSGAGTSTIAGGLAASLSKTGDGKVLLVDMNGARGGMHPFFAGKSASTLAAALEWPDSIPSAAENLYLATTGSANADGAVQLGPKRLFALMPQLKASDFDYIIFDMPPLGPTSPTSAMARFMDSVLLLVEAERSSEESVQRAYGELVTIQPNVSIIFNKARTYGAK